MPKLTTKIPVIDLFAGPGGLGEGFMSIMDKSKSVFDIKLSIEKDEHAHKTLTWRSFYRQFTKDGKTVPKDYYDALKECDLVKREALIESVLNRYTEGKLAKYEAQRIELGNKKWSDKTVDKIITERLGKKSKDWVLIGGPPCQAYSLVGRARVGGIDSEDHRVYLYQQYLRIISKHRPAIFVMENVKGLLSAEVNGEKVFPKILRDLKLTNANGVERYNIYSFVKEVNQNSDYLIRSENYGIPQKRHRVILLGIRNDIKKTPTFLQQTKEATAKSVLDKLPKLRSGLNRSHLGFEMIVKDGKKKKRRLYENVEDSEKAWNELMMNNINQIQDWKEFSLNGLGEVIEAPKASIGSEYLPKKNTLSQRHPLYSWFHDSKLGGVINHQSRSHLTQDLMRYLYSTIYVKKHQTFPRLADYAKHGKHLLPDHENVESGKFTDRFRVQLPEQPATTITCHISKDGHYNIHYDPKQCRSLTVREAARIQTFPDNYLFRGSRTKQYHQVGNAVPPFLAKQIAEIVLNILKKP